MNRETLERARPIAIGGSAVLLLFLIIQILIHLLDLMAVVFLGAVLALALNPIVDVLQRVHFPRILSILLVYGLVAIVVGAFSYLAAVEMGKETFTIEVDSFRIWYEDLAESTALPPVAEIEDAARELAAGFVGNLIGQTFALVTGAFYFITILVSALLFSVTQERIRALLLAMMEERRRGRTTEMLDILGYRLRRFVVGELAAMFIVGLMTYIGLVVLDVRFPLFLAFLAFIFEILPLIGPWIAFLPALAVALTEGPRQAIEVAILYLVIQQIESYVIVPLVHGRHNQMPAFLILMAVLIGGSLKGVLGALVALPIAVILYTLFFELVVPWRTKQVENTSLLVMPNGTNSAVDT